MAKQRLKVMNNPLYTPMICISSRGLCISDFLIKYNQLRQLQNKKTISQVAMSQHIGYLVENEYLFTKDTKKFKRRIYRMNEEKLIKDFLVYFEEFGLQSFDNRIIKFEFLDKNINLLKDLHLSVDIKGNMDILMANKKIFQQYCTKVKSTRLDKKITKFISSVLYKGYIVYFDYPLCYIFKNIILTLGKDDDILDWTLSTKPNQEFLSFITQCSTLRENVLQENFLDNYLYATSLLEADI